MDLAEILYQSLSSPYGRVVHTSDPEKLRQKLYTYRRENFIEGAEGLSFVISPTSPASELWVVKKHTKGVSNGSQE